MVKKKVLVILNRLVIGGQALDTIPLLYNLQGDFDILVLYGCPEKDEQEAGFLFEKYKNIHLQPIPTFKRRFNVFKDIKAFLFVLRTIKTFNPAVVHTHGIKSGLFGRTAAHFRHVPCIIHTFHGHHFHSYFNPFISGILVLYERLISRITTNIIAISPAQLHELAVKYKIAPPAKIKVIPLGIDENAFSDGQGEKRKNFRHKYNLPDSVVAIGIIGRVVPIKNYDLFVKIAARIISVMGEKVVFFIIGDGGEKVRVQDAFTKHGIGWRTGESDNPRTPVIFTSWVADVSLALHGLDVVVLTSHNEGTPMSLIEGQFCGKPVVSTDVGGAKDTFINNETGFLVPAGDDVVFVEKLALLTEDTDLRTQMGHKAALYAKEHFSKAKEINSFKTLYQDCPPQK